MLKQISFVSVVVADLEAAIKTYQNLFNLEVMVSTRISRVGNYRFAVLGSNGQPLFEIMEPTDPQGAVARLMQERANSQNPRGEGLYMVGVQVDDLGQTVKQIEAAGGRVNTDEAMPNVAWVHPLSTHYAFIELVQQRQ